MKILIPIKGSENERYFRRIAEVTPLREAEAVLLVHVIDTGAHDGVDLGRERFLGRRGFGGERQEDLVRAEEDRARAGLAFAREALGAVGVSPDAISAETLRGKPREVLRDLAEREGVAITVVRAREGKPGPHSLGKTARFLVDHVPGAVLLIR